MGICAEPDCPLDLSSAGGIVGHHSHWCQHRPNVVPMPPLDISSARWFSQGRPDLPFKQRHSTPAVELSPGRYFIMGGIDNTKACPDSFIYNAEDHTYNPVPLKPCCVFEHAAALMNDGRVVTFGGRQASRITQAVNIISFETNSFRQYLSLKNSPKARTCHTLTRLDSGAFLLYGGYGGHSNYFCDLYLFHVGREGPYWEKVSKPKGEVSKKRAGHSSILLPQGPYANKVLVFGGYNRQEYFNSIELISAGKKSWRWEAVEATGTLPFPRGCHSANLTADGNMLVWGGAGPRSVLLNDLNVLDTFNMTWSSPVLEGRAPTKRYAHCMFLTSQGLVVFGGMRQKDVPEQMKFLEFPESCLLPCTGCLRGTANAEQCTRCLNQPEAPDQDTDISVIADSSATNTSSSATNSSYASNTSTYASNASNNTSSAFSRASNDSIRGLRSEVLGSSAEDDNFATKHQGQADDFPDVEVQVVDDFPDFDAQVVDDFPDVDVFSGNSSDTENMMTHCCESDDSVDDTRRLSSADDVVVAEVADNGHGEEVGVLCKESLEALQTRLITAQEEAAEVSKTNEDKTDAITAELQMANAKIIELEQANEDKTDAITAELQLANAKIIELEQANRAMIEQANREMTPVYKTAASIFGLNPDPCASSGKLQGKFEAWVDDNSLFRNEVSTLVAEKSVLQASLGNAKNVLVQKQAELEQERKGAAQLCGHELSGLSADELTSIQKTLAEAGQRLLEHQEQLRITAMRNAQIEKDLLEDRSVCCICYVEPINAVLMPCAHLCSCHACAEALKDCPICRSVITQIIQTYMP